MTHLLLFLQRRKAAVPAPSRSNPCAVRHTAAVQGAWPLWVHITITRRCAREPAGPQLSVFAESAEAPQERVAARPQCPPPPAPTPA